MSNRFTVNTSELEIIRARQTLVGGGSLDGKRPDAWQVYGYPVDVTFAHLLTAYSRGGAGHGAIHRLLDGCWQGWPRIKQPKADKETPWEVRTAKVLTDIRGWAKLREFDRRNMVGKYAGLIYRIADNLAPDQPLIKGQSLVDLVPVYEDQLKVTAWHADKTAENYGQPAQYQYRTRPVQAMDTQGRPDDWIDIDPSRVQIMAEGSVGDMFDGVPLLLAGFNALVDVEKISGGSAESFLKNSARTLTIQYDVNANPTTIGADGKEVDVKQAHEDQARALNANTDATIVTQGAKTDVLQTTVSDPTGAFNLAGYLFAASVGLSFSGIFGQRLGQLASEQDRRADMERFKSRQVNELTPMLTEFVKRMQSAGIIDPGEFEIEWPDIAAPSDAEKLANAKAMTAAVREAFGAGLQDLFGVNEIRAAAGYEPVAAVVLPEPVAPEIRPTE